MDIPTLSNKTYDILNRVVKYILPAIGTAVLGIAEVWDIEGADKIVSTLVILTALLAAIIGVSSVAYKSERLEEPAEAGLNVFDAGEGETYEFDVPKTDMIEATTSQI